MKYIFTKAKLPRLSSGQILSVLKKYHTLSNKEFAQKIKEINMQLIRVGTTETPVKTSAKTVQPAELNLLFHQADISFPTLGDLYSSSHQSYSNPLKVKTVHNDSTSFVGLCSSIRNSHGHEDTIGKGKILVEFFYKNVENGSSIEFPAVWVQNDEEVKHVMALIKERVMEFNLKHRIHKPISMKYFSDTVIAKTMLPKGRVKKKKKKLGENSPRGGGGGSAPDFPLRKKNKKKTWA